MTDDYVKPESIKEERARESGNARRRFFSKSKTVGKATAKATYEGGKRILKGARPGKAVRKFKDKYDAYQDKQDEKRSRQIERLEHRADLLERKQAQKERITNLKKKYPSAGRRGLKSAQRFVRKAKSGRSYGESAYKLPQGFSLGNKKRGGGNLGFKL